MKKLSTRISIAALGLVGTASSAFAQDVAVAVPTDSVFILNSLLFLIGGFLVFWMAAGFAMLEAGLVRSKNVTMQLTKNMALFSLAAVFYYLIGYNLNVSTGDLVS
jgi:Amt family ammonium transporter